MDPEINDILQRAVPGARVLRAVSLAADDGAQASHVTAKSVGYGVPIRVDAEVGGRERSYVLHGARSDRFGHDRRADRAAELLLAADTFGSIPQHARVVDVGAFQRHGGSIGLHDAAEFYLLTEYVAGRPYAEDLRRIARERRSEPRDAERQRRLLDYLALLHAQHLAAGGVYQRSLRDLLGSGEGIFGIVDAYPPDAPGAPPHRLRRIEERCLAFRWKLKERAPRLARSHGDFHPFNVLFDEQGELILLDTSRGSAGDPADDVACMAVNYVFFALEEPASWRAAFAALWHDWWAGYQDRTGDVELLSVVAPFLSWRLLVLACPAWYPNLGPVVRDSLLGLAEAALEAERFDPSLAEALFR